ncbi:OmpA family protein [Vibrio fluvialis]|uniref:OmpA family protein n=1 Tax=Vibrio fluvialis TaxID=676 RepID=UPI002B26284C|nr:OmpA family protein [Vibrio fluvialis]WPK54440.1 OmpA family protein [Vibrio fluvialis]
MNKCVMLSLFPLLLLVGCADPVDTQLTRYQMDDLRDSDGDGVINQRDNCADSPTNSTVDNQGCANWHNKPEIHVVSFFFDMDKYDLKQDHREPLNELMAILNDNPSAKVILIGDTSPEASMEYNRVLAEKRTAVIRSLLIKHGISEHRIEEQEFSQQTSLTQHLKERKRRTIAVVRTQAKRVDQRWTIFSSDTSLTPNSKVEISNEN